MSRRDSSGGTAVESTRPEDTSDGITKHSHVTGRVFIWPRELALTATRPIVLGLAEQSARPQGSRV